MNEDQERHVKAMANKIETHGNSILSRVQALQRSRLQNMPVDLARTNFKDVTDACQEIYKVLADMLPKMPYECTIHMCDQKASQRLTFTSGMRACYCDEHACIFDPSVIDGREQLGGGNYELGHE